MDQKYNNNNKQNSDADHKDSNLLEKSKRSNTRKQAELDNSKSSIDSKNETLSIFEKNLFDLPNEKLKLVYAKEHYELFHVFNYRYGKNSVDWYGALKAIGFSDKQIKQIKGKHTKGKPSKNKQKKKEVNEQNLILFIKELPNLPDDELIFKYAKEHYELFHVFNYRYGKNSVDWYDALKAIGFSDERINNIRKKNFKNSAKKMEEAVKELRTKSDAELTSKYGKAHYPLYHSIVKKIGDGSWYNALEAIGISKKRVARIKLLAKNNSIKTLRKKTISDEVKIKREKLIAWFNDNEIEEFPTSELTKFKFKARFPDKWKEINEAFGSYIFFLRVCEMPEQEVQLISELSIMERPDITSERRYEFARILESVE